MIASSLLGVSLSLKILCRLCLTFKSMSPVFLDRIDSAARLARNGELLIRLWIMLTM